MKTRSETKTTEGAEDLQKVCFLLPVHWSVAMGGAEFQARELLRTMHSTGKYDIYFLARDVATSGACESYRLIKIRKLNVLSKYGYFFDSLHLLKLLDAIKPDTIYQRVGCAYTGIAARYAQKNKCRLVWHVSSTDDVTPAHFSFAEMLRRPHHYLEKKILEYGIRHIDEFIVQTEDQRRLLKTHYHKNAKQLVRNFIQVPELLEKQNKPVRVLWIGNLKPLKQPQIFVSLARQLARPGEIEFVMIGAAFHEAAQQQNFENEIKAIDGLSYLGKIEQSEVNKQLESAHLLVNTSIYEGFSNTFIQAWMQCVPVVSLNVNPDGLFDEGSLGLFSDNVESLVKDVQHLCEDSQARKEMGDHARQFAINNFSMKNAETLEKYLGNAKSLKQIGQHSNKIQ